jgi:hypothetical protein
MTRPQEEPDVDNAADVRASWEPPTLTEAGKVRDLVHGGSKASGGTEGDAGTFKKAGPPF